MNSRTLSAVLLYGLLTAWTLTPTCRAQAPAAGDLGSIEAIDAEYQRELVEAEKVRLDRLAKLAASQKEPEASQTHVVLLQDAITANLFDVVEPLAETLLKKAEISQEARFLANAVNVIAEVDRGAYAESVASVRAAMAAGKAARANGEPLPVPTRLAVGEIYFSRLLQRRQYDTAREVFELIRSNTDDETIRAYAEGRLKRLSIVGKPAPALKGTDMDGRPFQLADLKGNVVLVLFWASWCLPNAQEIDTFLSFEEAYRDRGLRVVGINLDALQEDTDLETVMPNIKRFLLDYNVAWPNLINGAGEADFAGMFGVTEIPSNVLIGPDGTVVDLDVGANLDERLGELLPKAK